MPSARRTAARAIGPESAGLKLVGDPLRVLLSLLTVVTISRVHLHYPVLAALRPVLLLSICAIGYAYLHPKSISHTQTFKLWPMRLVALLGVLACCSAAFGISLGNSAQFILDSFSKTIAYAFLIAVSVRSVRDLYTYVWAYVVSCGILAFFAVFVFQLETGGNLPARLGELYTYDSNDLGVLLMIGLPLTLLLLFVDKGLKRWLLLVNLVGISAAMARSGSRGGFLGLVAVGVATLFLANGVSTAKRVFLLAAASVTLTLAAPPGYWDQMATIMSPKKDYNYSSIDGRNALIQRGIGYMMKYPVFGIGIWNFAKAECTISTKVETRARNEALRCTAPHNSFVQAGAELGVPGIAIWISLLVGLVVAPLRLRRTLPRSWRRGTGAERFLYASMSFFPVAMCGFAATGFFVSFAFADPIYLMAGLEAALLTVTRAQLSESRPESSIIANAPLRGAPGWRVARSARRFIPSSLLGQAG
jgi:hypothetical protein